MSTAAGIPNFHSDEYIERMKVFLSTYKIPKIAKNTTKLPGRVAKKTPRRKPTKTKLI